MSASRLPGTGRTELRVAVVFCGMSGMVDRTEHQWRNKRVALKAVLVLWFCAIAFYFGPNMVLFGKLSSLKPADFRPYVEQTAIPLLQSIGQYRRENGHMPDWIDFRKPNHSASPPIFDFHEDDLIIRTRIWNHSLEYDLRTNNGTWSVHGAFVKGEVPVSDEARRATTQALAP